MKAVADVLGVDRKALSYHVSDRDTLLGFVAADAVLTAFSEVEIAEAPWQAVCRAYATGLTESVSAAGKLADHIRLTNATALTFLRPTEVLLGRLIQAGFSDETARGQSFRLKPALRTQTSPQLTPRRRRPTVPSPWLRKSARRPTTP